MREKKYSDAIQTIEPAIRDTGSPVTRRSLQILLAQATAKNPKWRKRAEAILQEVLEDDPSSVEARYELAKLYQANGLESQAQREFRRVLELDPAHKGAAAAQTETP